MPNSITPSQIGCGWTSVALAVDYKKNCRSRRHGIIRLQFVFGAVCFPRLYIVIGAICYRPQVRRITHLLLLYVLRGFCLMCVIHRYLHVVGSWSCWLVLFLLFLL